MPKKPMFSSELTSITKRARVLHDWARFTLFNEAQYKPPGDLRYSESAFRKKSRTLKQKLAETEKHHSALNNFFDQLGLSLPQSHVMCRSWERRLDALRTAAARPRKGKQKQPLSKRSTPASASRKGSSKSSTTKNNS